MTRNIISLIMLTTLAAAVSVHAQSTPGGDRPSSKNANSAENQKNQARTSAAPSTRLVKGWNYVKDEWVHSDGYKYVNGQVIRTGGPTHKRPPNPPSKSLLNSVRIKPTPTPAPGSAAAKAAEKERNLQTRPASQTGSHL